VLLSVPSVSLWFGLTGILGILNTPPGYGIVLAMETTIAVDEQVQKKALRRLSIIEGQVRGLRRMVEESTGCVEVLTQISAVHEALRGVGKLIVRHHIETCVTEGLQTDKKQQHQDELIDLIYKLSK
jgi:DNA-binding FrmR family transcriptional regulator